MTCPRLATYLQHLKRQHRHLDADDLDRVKTNHETLGCPDCRGFRIPPCTPREAP